MYLGTVTETIPLWGQRWQPWGLQSYRAGVTTQERHRYRCEHCGREHAVICKAEEPFFCYCQQLIALTEDSRE